VSEIQHRFSLYNIKERIWYKGGGAWSNVCLVDLLSKLMAATCGWNADWVSFLMVRVGIVLLLLLIFLLLLFFSSFSSSSACNSIDVEYGWKTIRLECDRVCYFHMVIAPTTDRISGFTQSGYHDTSSIFHWIRVEVSRRSILWGCPITLNQQ